MSIELTRRNLLRATLTAAGGLLIGFRIPAFAGAKPYEPHKISGAELNAWLAIEPDDSVLIRVAQAEMGQGVMTALPMILADELEVDWRKVRVEYADIQRTDAPYGSMVTGDSQAVRRSRPILQQAGAEARERLIKAAAERWIVDPKECYADYGEVHHRPTRRTLPYGALASAAAKVSIAGVKIKTPEQFTLIGLTTNRLDTPPKVNGSAVYSMDVRVADMVYAAVVHCPHLGGRLRGYRFNAIRNLPGVIRAVRLDRGVAVVAESYWQAKTAADKLPVQWTYGDEAKAYSETFRKEYSAALNTEGKVIKREGDTDPALETAERIVESDYFVPYLAHAALEPLNCTVSVTADRVDIWAGTQDPQAVVDRAVALTGRSAAQIHVHNCYLGGSFGRRRNTDYIEEAILIALDAALPVQMIWSREDDMRAGQYRPTAALRFKAGFDLDRNLVAYTNHSVTHSVMQDIRGQLAGDVDATSVAGLVDMPYDFRPKTISHTVRNTHVPTWWWRSMGHSQNAFAMECFVDELAEAARQDPVDFRRRYLAHRPDLLNVLEELVQKSGWRKPLAAGRAQGLALHECFGTIVGAVAEVSLSSGGSVNVHRMVIVVDCGNLVNPGTAEAQVEGAVIFGLSAALYGKITIEKGVVLEDNFDTYRVLEMNDTPQIDTHFIEATDDRWGGLGEPGVPPVAPAIVNAVFRITGRRIRALPLSDFYLRPG